MLISTAFDGGFNNFTAENQTKMYVHTFRETGDGGGVSKFNCLLYDIPKAQKKIKTYFIQGEQFFIKAF